MQILLAFLFGAAAGLLVHATVPGRDTRGAVLAPAIGTVTAGTAWAIMTWAGVALDNPWLWIVAVAAPLAVAYPLIAVLRTARRRRDDADTAGLPV